MNDNIRYAKVGGPPDNWMDLIIVRVHADGRRECVSNVVEVNTAEGWAIVLDGKYGGTRIEGSWRVLPPLSDDAKAAASVFSMMPVGSSGLSYTMVEMRPPARFKAALDELVEAGMLLPHNITGTAAIRYEPAFNMWRYRKYAHLGAGMNMAERIDGDPKGSTTGTMKMVVL